MSANRMKANSVRSRNNENGEDTRAQWSTQSFTIEDIQTQFSFPQIIKCNQQSILVKRESPIPINLAQPILLFDKRTIRKLLARNVVFDPTTQRYAENDETVVIPADYEGAFLRLQSRTAKESTSHRTIESLGQHHVRAFINMTKITAFVIGYNQQVGNYVKIDYTPGNVFLVEGAFQGSARVRTESKFLHMKSNTVQQVRYLKCKDEKDVFILIPMAQTGEFIEILPSQYGNGKMSVTSENLIATQKFPIVVRFISGRNRPRLTSFSGLFTLLDSFEETTIVGCMLDQHGFTMIELPLSSPLTFQLALNSHDLFGHPVVRKALRLCEGKSHAFCRDLKYKFKFAQQIKQVGGRPLTARSASVTSQEDDTPPSATNSARFGVTTTYIYI